MQNIIAIENGVVRHPLYRMKKPINMTLAEGEHIAIVGPNGAGKSILVDTIIGRWPLLMNEVKYDFSPSPSKMVYDILLSGTLMGMQTVIIIINSAGIPMIWMKRLSFVTFCRKLRIPN